MYDIAKSVAKFFYYFAIYVRFFVKKRPFKFIDFSFFGVVLCLTFRFAS